MNTPKRTLTNVLLRREISSAELRQDTPKRAALAAALLVPGLALTACTPAGASAGDTSAAAASAPEAAAPTQEASRAHPRLAMTYDGGVMVFDAAAGEVVLDEPLAGFNRVNPAGDGRHVLVSTATGFRVLDTGAWSEPHGDHSHHYTSAPSLTEAVFPATTPGHAVVHGGTTALFDDGTGTVQLFDPRELSGLAEGLPQTTSYVSEHAHHGVALQLQDGSLLVTEGDSESRNGIKVLSAPAADGSRTEIAHSDDCPGVHGEAALAGETIVVGCEDGLLAYRDARITKIDAPDEYARIGNQAGSVESAVVLGDYKTDPDAELERPTRISLTDTATGTMKLVELGASYTFRSLGRGPSGEALVLATDGTLRVIDPKTAKQAASIEVMDAWEEPLEWQQPRPALYVQGTTAYVTEPATNQLHTIDLVGGRVLGSTELPHTPNEFTGIPG
ncbi:zinc metallochaperone AztD [Arthrobacter ginkgonis]|uniref:Zinc metallochaperone AztD n=1 Tax=Arthrobacter ginkgonis TaxID=1630594 RepID=A0ABP7C4J2_9MICC